MIIEAMSNGRQFSCYADVLITQNFNNLIGVSLVGNEVSVKAVSASIIEGRDLYTNGTVLHTYSNRYSRPTPVHIGNHIFHTICIDQRSYFKKYVDKNQIMQRKSRNNKDNMNKVIKSVILAPDGNMRTRVGEYLAAKCTLPVEWLDMYYEMVKVMPLEVYAEKYSPWKNLKAVLIEYKESEILSKIDNDLKTRKLIVPSGQVQGKFNSNWSINEYMFENAEVFSKQLKKIRPYFLPSKDRPNIKLLEMHRVPLIPQVNAIMGLYNYLQKNDSAIIVGDMGVGKSIMSLGVAHLIASKSKNKTVLLSAPELTLPKWVKEEIIPTLPWAKIRYLNNTKDAARYLKEVRNGYKPDRIEFVLIGTDRVKLGHDPWCSAVWKWIKGTKTAAWHCPRCYNVLPDPEENKDNTNIEETIPAGFYTLVKEGIKPPRPTGRPNGLPENWYVKWNHKTKLKKCPHCGEVLWRPAMKSRNETNRKPRYAIYKILRKIKNHFSLLIVDELHKCKAQDSGRGYAFGQLINCCSKVLGLTGTIVNGMASSYQQILWRMDPKTMLENGFNHNTGPIAFAEKYGTLQEVIRIEEGDIGYHTQKKRTALQPRELPGISPKMPAEFLMDRAVYIDQYDLGLPLVEFKEIPVFLDLDPSHAADYKTFHEQLYDKARRAARAGSKGAFSKFIPATINYADRPDLGAYVQIGKDVITAPKTESTYYHAKERWLVDTVKKELSEDRRVIIYANYTDGYSLDKRIHDVLKAHGIHSRILKSSVKREKRMGWIQQAADDGVEVIISNLQLLELGLNILMYPTEIYYQLTYQDDIIRQGSRRPWRIQQHREVRVYYLVYNGTQQMAQFLRIMSKRAHALMVEGKIGRSEIANRFGRDKHNALAQDLYNCIARKKDSENWKYLANKDIDSRLEILSEEKYKKLQAQRLDQEIRKAKIYIKTGKIVELPAREITAEPPKKKEFDSSSKIVSINSILTTVTKKKRRRNQQTKEIQQVAFLFDEVG